MAPGKRSDFEDEPVTLYYGGMPVPVPNPITPVLPSKDEKQEKMKYLEEHALLLGLSPAQVRVAVLVAMGLRNSLIASELFVTEKTVKFHCTNIYKKLGVKSRLELAIKLVAGFRSASGI